MVWLTHLWTGCFLGSGLELAAFFARLVLASTASFQAASRRGNLEFALAQPAPGVRNYYEIG